jgi:hypothetical protein
MYTIKRLVKFRHTFAFLEGDPDGQYLLDPISVQSRRAVLTGLSADVVDVEHARLKEESSFRSGQGFSCCCCMMGVKWRRTQGKNRNVLETFNPNVRMLV